MIKRHLIALSAIGCPGARNVERKARKQYASAREALHAATWRLVDAHGYDGRPQNAVVKGWALTEEGARGIAAESPRMGVDDPRDSLIAEHWLPASTKGVHQHSRKAAIAQLTSYSPESLPIRCGVCNRKAIVQILGVQVGPFGGHWLRIPPGWWLSLGTTVLDIRDHQSGIRCPSCFGKTEEWVDDN